MDAKTEKWLRRRWNITANITANRLMQDRRSMAPSALWSSVRATGVRYGGAGCSHAVTSPGFLPMR